MAHPFSTTSLARLESVDPRLRGIITLAAARWDITVLEGHRSSRRQQALYMSGKSKVRYGKHNEQPSLAIDIAPSPIDWDDLERFRRLAEYVLGIANVMGVKIRWGGDWDGDTDLNDQTFNDLVHFEITEG
jgi:peptidoglycan L-alanyl-D-glutamate endopeptidase CwlK